MYSKYMALINQGLYVTKLEAEKQQEQLQTQVNFSFIQKSYASVSDSLDVSEREIKDYYKLHKEDYRQEESRDLQYVAFDVIPSKTDFSDAEKWINDILPEFKEITDVKEFLRLNSYPPDDIKNYKKGELPDTLDQFMFDAKEGAVYGPYFEDNSYKLAKLAKILYLPDSVRVSEIELPFNQDNFQQVRVLADSLDSLAKNGVNFTKLVRENSRGRTAMQGGDIGWVKEGTNGPAFSDSVFSAKLGEVKLTFTQNNGQYAYHIIKVTQQSKLIKQVRVGILTKKVEPSAQTDNLYYSKASTFAGANNTLAKFEAATRSGEPKAVRAYGLKPRWSESLQHF